MWGEGEEGEMRGRGRDAAYPQISENIDCNCIMGRERSSEGTLTSQTVKEMEGDL